MRLDQKIKEEHLKGNKMSEDTMTELLQPQGNRDCMWVNYLRNWTRLSSDKTRQRLPP